MKGYILNNYKVSKTTCDFISAKLRGLAEGQRRLFLHVLCNHLLDLQRKKREIVSGYDSLGIQIPSIMLKAELGRRFSWTKDGVALRGLIEASEYRTGECRYYQVVPALLDEILAHIEQQVKAPDGSPAVNLFDGRAYVPPPVGERTGAPPSKLVRHAIERFAGVECPVNAAAIQAHLERLKKEPNKDLAFQNDRLCAHSAFAGMRSVDGIGYYTPSYLAQSSGRIGEQGGGLQSCSKAMKEAAFSDVPRIHNYDLRSSQGYVLLQELQLAGIDDKWLAAHLGPGVFEARSERLGLSKKTYKKCFFAMIMGASHVWFEQGHIGAVQHALIDELKDVGLARQKFAEVIVELRPLKELVSKWTSWLLDDPSCPHRKVSKRKEILRNAAGHEMVLDRSRPAKEVRREAAAHILQGQEAAFIHHLTIIADQFGYTPVSNQHDGLVTIGEVPEAAQKKAAELSGLSFAFLEEKPFC